MIAVTRRTSAGIREAPASGGSEAHRGARARFCFRLSLVAGFVAGAGVALGFAQASRSGSESAAPADRRESPPTRLDERPSVPPIRIGMGSDASNLPILSSSPISGASAPTRGSAYFWRNGGASLTAAASSLMSGQRV